MKDYIALVTVELHKFCASDHRDSSGHAAATDRPRRLAMCYRFRQVSPAMTDPTASCLFCRIIRGEIPAKKVYEDEHVFAFEDISPQAPTHVLIIPKKHFAGLKEAEAADAELIGYCHLAAARIARQRNIEQGYRTVLNVGPRRRAVGLPSACPPARRTIAGLAPRIVCPPQQMPGARLLAARRREM